MKTGYIINFIPVILICLNSCSDLFTNSELKTIHFPGTGIIKQTIEYKNGKKNGFFLEYFKSGVLKAKQRYINDTLTDTTYIYYENGKLADFQIHDKGMRTGCWKKYNKSGMLYSEICFEDDALEGTSSVYTYKTVRLLERFNYKKGRKHGKQELFYNNGKKKSITYFWLGKEQMGTEEWYEDGEKVNNDFKISVTEKNEILMKNSLTYIIKLENPQKDDWVYELASGDTGIRVSPFRLLKKIDDCFVLEYELQKNGGFVMQHVKLGAYRTTKMGNTFIKTTDLNVSGNNF